MSAMTLRKAGLEYTRQNTRVAELCFPSGGMARAPKPPTRNALLVDGVADFVQINGKQTQAEV